MTKITKRKIRKLITEEKASSRMYRRYGLGGIAKDETRHSKHLKRLLKGGKK
jgi:hypothetical protein